MAFENIRSHAHHLLATADVQLGTLPKAVVQNRWGYQLGILRDALDQLNSLNEEWLHTRNTLPGPGTTVFDDALAEHHAECWSSLDDWATHAHVLRDINSAARHASSPLAPPPTVTAAPSPSRATPVRR